MAKSTDLRRGAHPGKSSHTRMVITTSVMLAAVPLAAVVAAMHKPTPTQKASISVNASSGSSTTAVNSPATALPTAANVTPDTNSSSNTSVTVNGQAIPVPSNGTVNQTISSNDDSTDVAVSTSPDPSSNSSHTSVHINVNSSSSNSTERSTSNIHVSNH